MHLNERYSLKTSEKQREKDKKTGGAFKREDNKISKKYDKFSAIFETGLII